MGTGALGEGQAQGGYTDVFELICCGCGDYPDLDYRDIPRKLQRIRGPYPIAAGITAYDEHLKQHHERAPGPPVPQMQVTVREAETAERQPG